MRKGYTDYSEMEPYTDGWVNTAYSGTGNSDHVCRPIVVDAEGRKNPIFGFASSHNTEGYVLKAERIVEHISHTAPVVRLVSDYDYVSEPAGDYKRYDHPKKVKDFLTKVQNDVSRPATKASIPFNSNWRAPPNYKGNPGTDPTKYSDDSNHIWEKPSEAYPQTYKGTTPIINDNNMYYERPRDNEGPVVPSHPLSKPTNDIGTAVDFLTEAIKPINIQTGATRPNKVVPFGYIPRRIGTNLAAKDSKVDSDDDDYGRDKIPGHREPTNRIDNNSAMYYEKPAPIPAPSQQPRFTVPTMQNKEKYSPQPPPDTIDSSEARGRYGKLKPQPVPEDAYTGTINSDEVVKKYNGTKVPW